MSYPTLFARQEPTTDSVLLQMKSDSRKQDVVLYHDEQCTDAAGRFPWYATNKPAVNKQRFTNINCARYALAWVPPVITTTATMGA